MRGASLRRPVAYLAFVVFLGDPLVLTACAARCGAHEVPATEERGAAAAGAAVEGVAHLEHHHEPAAPLAAVAGRQRTSTPVAADTSAPRFTVVSQCGCATQLGVELARVTETIGPHDGRGQVGVLTDVVHRGDDAVLSTSPPHRTPLVAAPGARSRSVLRI